MILDVRIMKFLNARCFMSIWMKTIIWGVIYHIQLNHEMHLTTKSRLVRSITPTSKWKSFSFWPFIFVGLMPGIILTVKGIWRASWRPLINFIINILSNRGASLCNSVIAETDERKGFWNFLWITHNLRNLYGPCKQRTDQCSKARSVAFIARWLATNIFKK